MRSGTSLPTTRHRPGRGRAGEDGGGRGRAPPILSGSRRCSPPRPRRAPASTTSRLLSIAITPIFKRAARTRAVLERKLRRWLLEATRVEELLALRLDEVADGRRSPYDVAAEILDQVKAGEGGDANR